MKTFFAKIFPFQDIPRGYRFNLITDFRTLDRRIQQLLRPFHIGKVADSAFEKKLIKLILFQISDLLFLLFCVPFTAADYALTSVWYFGEVCKKQQERKLQLHLIQFY